MAANFAVQIRQVTVRQDSYTNFLAVLTTVKREGGSYGMMVLNVDSVST